MEPPLKRRTHFGGTWTAIIIGAGISMSSPLALAGSSQPAPLNPGQIVRPGGTNYPAALRFTIITSEKVYNQGETIALNLNFKNEGKDTWRYVEAGPIFMYKFNTVLPDGKRGQPTARGRKILDDMDPGNLIRGILKPGDVEIKTLQSVNRRYEMTLPGRYETSVSLAVRKDGTSGPNQSRCFNPM